MQEERKGVGKQAKPTSAGPILAVYEQPAQQKKTATKSKPAEGWQTLKKVGRSKETVSQETGVSKPYEVLMEEIWVPG